MSRSSSVLAPMLRSCVAASHRWIRSQYCSGAISTQYPSPSCRRISIRPSREFHSSRGRWGDSGSQSTNLDSGNQKSSHDSASNPHCELVYESPLGNLVTRLRAVSLSTGLCGSVGLPLVVMAKGGIDQLPSTGLLAMGMTFVAGTLGSTAAIHFVFSPYVFTIERIPIRLCQFKLNQQQETQHEQEQPDSDSVQSTPSFSIPTTLPPKKDVLYKAVSKSLFLTRKETVFDPALDVVPYQGLRPMCNILVKGQPLYVHPEYVYPDELRRALKLPEQTKLNTAEEQRDNPDDFL